MRRSSTSQWFSKALRVGNLPSSASLRIPAFLCPAAQFTTTTTPVRKPLPRRSLHLEASSEIAPSVDIETISPSIELLKTRWRKLPLTCHGCGAFTQTKDPHAFGYFNPESKRIRSWQRPRRSPGVASESGSDRVVEEALRGVDPQKLEELGLDPATLTSGEEVRANNILGSSWEKAPVCERCHKLIHNGATSELVMHHPTVDSLRQTIEESPHKLNHIYHIIDAADFPMSLIPRLNVLLGDVQLRSRNRRSRASPYHRDRKTELSFIITRSDLLAPTKAAVDSMMPYLRAVLRESLGRLGNRVRLGNVRCVSAKRGWWTKTLKEDIWRRGGAGWMVGKVNVGKSQLFEAVYPKGRLGLAMQAEHGNAFWRDNGCGPQHQTDQNDEEARDGDDHDVGALLPPPQRLTMYPEMPLVSPLPGTTASPIRLPFGNGKGELVDLPGLARSDLELFVKEEHRTSLIMKTRIVPEQRSVKMGDSLLLGGGLIRITPRTPNLTFLLYNFTPLSEHLTSTEKAVGFQEQTRQSIGVENVTVEGVGDQMKLAGTFRLGNDVTKTRAGPLTRKNAVGLSVDRLPFRVLSVDILIEGVGYVEVVAQVRTRDMRQFPPLDAPIAGATKGDEEGGDEKQQTSCREANDPFAVAIRQRRHDSAQGPEVEAEQLDGAKGEHKREREWPIVDVFTPGGRFVGSRRPINGWMHNKPVVRDTRQRPRKSMKGQKKKAKREARTAGAAAAAT